MGKASGVINFTIPFLNFVNGAVSGFQIGLRFLLRRELSEPGFSGLDPEGLFTGGALQAQNLNQEA